MRNATASRFGSSNNTATRLVLSCSMPTLGKPTSSSLDPTGDADGSGFGKVPLVNGCSAARLGQC